MLDYYDIEIRTDRPKEVPFRSVPYYNSAQYQDKENEEYLYGVKDVLYPDVFNDQELQEEWRTRFKAMQGTKMKKVKKKIPYMGSNVPRFGPVKLERVKQSDKGKLVIIEPIKTTSEELTNWMSDLKVKSDNERILALLPAERSRRKPFTGIEEIPPSIGICNRQKPWRHNMKKITPWDLDERLRKKRLKDALDECICTDQDVLRMLKPIRLTILERSQMKKYAEPGKSMEKLLKERSRLKKIFSNENAVKRYLEKYPIWQQGALNNFFAFPHSGQSNYTKRKLHLKKTCVLYARSTMNRTNQPCLPLREIEPEAKDEAEGGVEGKHRVYPRMEDAEHRLVLPDKFLDLNQWREKPEKFPRPHNCYERPEQEYIASDARLKLSGEFLCKRLWNKPLSDEALETSSGEEKDEDDVKRKVKKGRTGAKRDKAKKHEKVYNINPMEFDLKDQCQGNKEISIVKPTQPDVQAKSLKANTAQDDVASFRACEREASATPGPGKYDIVRWPYFVQWKQNKAGFNSGKKRICTEFKSCAPGAGTYHVRQAWEQQFGPTPQRGTFGGQQILEPAYETRCGDVALEKCIGCTRTPQLDHYWISYRFGAMCNECYSKETKLHAMFNKIELETFRPARHCSFMHKHFNTKVYTVKPKKELDTFLRKEAYFAKFSGSDITERNSRLMQPLAKKPARDLSEFISMIDQCGKTRKLSGKAYRAWLQRKKKLIERHRYRIPEEKPVQPCRIGGKRRRKSRLAGKAKEKREEQTKGDGLTECPQPLKIPALKVRLEAPKYYKDLLDGIEIMKRELEDYGDDDDELPESDGEDFLGLCREKPVKEEVEDKEYDIKEKKEADEEFEDEDEDDEEQKGADKEKGKDKQEGEGDEDDEEYADENVVEEQKPKEKPDEEDVNIEAFNSKCELVRIYRLSQHKVPEKQSRKPIFVHETVPALPVDKMALYSVNEELLPWFLKESFIEKKKQYKQEKLEEYRKKREEHIREKRKKELEMMALKKQKQKELEEKLRLKKYVKQMELEMDPSRKEEWERERQKKIERREARRKKEKHEEKDDKNGLTAEDLGEEVGESKKEVLRETNVRNYKIYRVVKPIGKGEEVADLTLSTQFHAECYRSDEDEDEEEMRKRKCEEDKPGETGDKPPKIWVAEKLVNDFDRIDLDVVLYRNEIVNANTLVHESESVPGEGKLIPNDIDLDRAMAESFEKKIKFLPDYYYTKENTSALMRKSEDEGPNRYSEDPLAACKRHLETESMDYLLAKLAEQRQARRDQIRERMLSEKATVLYDSVKRIANRVEHRDPIFPRKWRYYRGTPNL